MSTLVETTSTASSDPSTLYKLGDFVYLNATAGNPYHIRRIDGIIRTDTGVNLKTQSFTRRRDIPTSLIQLADKNIRELEEDIYEEQYPELSDEQKHRLNHHELYFNRPSGVETVKATDVRGKCDVIMLNTVSKLKDDYLDKKDNFFYALVYDQNQRTIVTDRGDIRVGPTYQCEVRDRMSQERIDDYDDDRNLEELETLVFDGANIGEQETAFDDEDVKRMITMAKSVGLYARALDAQTASVHPLLQNSAALASRDCTLQWAMDALHKAGYDLGEAVKHLITNQGPTLPRDQFEAWSPSETQLFEDGMDRYGKDFTLIKKELLPWKTMPAVIEYYYMWKASDRYLAYKRNKAIEQEKQLKQIEIPKISQKFDNELTSSQMEGLNRLCEGCCSSCPDSEKWFNWGQSNQNHRLCQICWNYWMRNGGLKIPQSQRIELLQQQRNKIPGQNDEKKTSLRVSTQLTAINQQKTRELKEHEKAKKLEEKKKSLEGSPKKTSEDEIDTKKLARSPLDSELVSEEKIAEISKDFDENTENDENAENNEDLNASPANEPEQMDIDEPEVKKQKVEEN